MSRVYANSRDLKSSNCNRAQWLLTKLGYAHTHTHAQRDQMNKRSVTIARLQITTFCLYLKSAAEKKFYVISQHQK